MSFFPEDVDDKVSAKKTTMEWLKDIQSQVSRIPENIGVVKSIIKTAFEDGLVNDREYDSKS